MKLFCELLGCVALGIIIGKVLLLVGTNAVNENKKERVGAVREVTLCPLERLCAIKRIQ